MASQSNIFLDQFINTINQVFSSSVSSSTTSSSTTNVTAQPTYNPSFGGSQTETNVTYFNSNGPVFALENIADPSLITDVDRNDTTNLDNFNYIGYSLEEISQPSNITSINLLYNVEPNSLPRDVNGNIVIDENTNAAAGKRLNINLSANRYYTEDFDRVVDIEFTELDFPAPATEPPLTSDIPDGTLIRSKQQFGYFAVIEGGRRRFFAFDAGSGVDGLQLLRTVRSGSGRPLVDMESNIILQIPEGNDYKLVDYVGTGETTTNSHPIDAYILGLVNDPYANVSTNAASIVNREWLVTEWNYESELIGSRSGSVSPNAPNPALNRRILVFAANDNISNGSGLYPNVGTFRFPTNTSFQRQLMLWGQNEDGKLVLLVQGLTYIVTANFFSAQLTNGENILSIRFNHNNIDNPNQSFTVTYKCIEINTLTNTTTTLPTGSATPTSIPFTGIPWYVQEYSINSTSIISGSVNDISQFNNSSNNNFRLIRFDENTNQTGILPRPGNFANPSNGFDIFNISWVTGSDTNRINASYQFGPSINTVDITGSVDTNSILTISITDDSNITYTYRCTTTP